MNNENEALTTAESTDPMSGFDRALMAEERTCSAWIRTGLASMATGLAIAKIMPHAEPRWAVAALGMTLVLVAVLSYAIAFAGYARGAKSCQPSARNSLPWWVLAIFCNLLALAAVLTASFILQDVTIP
ncbi:MAG: YidH family protein [Blastopirellula sp. JB062]